MLRRQYGEPARTWVGHMQGRPLPTVLSLCPFLLGIQSSQDRVAFCGETNSASSVPVLMFKPLALMPGDSLISNWKWPDSSFVQFRMPSGTHREQGKSAFFSSLRGPLPCMAQGSSATIQGIDCDSWLLTTQPLPVWKPHSVACVCVCSCVHLMCQDQEPDALGNCCENS